MEPLAAVTLAFALLVIASRAPLMFAPNAVLELYRTLLATLARVRVLGLVTGALGAGFALTAPSAAELHPTASSGLAVLGWVLIVGSAWLLVLPRAYQVVAESLLSAFSDPSVLRVLGALGTAFGAALAWLAFEIR